MTAPRYSALGVLAVFALALLAPFVATAQAPAPVVRYVRIDADDYRCQLINSTPTETIPQQELTIVPPPTFTPSILATATPDTPPTAEYYTPYPTAQNTPLSGCSGRVLALSGLNVRTTPNGARIGSLGYGANVDLFGYVWDTFDNKWYRVQWGARWGYIHAGWIAPDPACWGLMAD